MIVKYSEDLNPFLYALNADVGYRQYTDGGGGAGLVGVGLDLVLPIGLRATLGFTPAGLRVTYGGDRAGPELVSRFFRLDYQLKKGLFLTVDAPMEVNWLKPRVEWTFGVGLLYAPPSNRLSKDRGLLLSKETLATRQDDAWVPPPAPYGHILGRRRSWYVVAGATVADRPEDAAPGRNYGLGLLGGEVAWDRNRWGGRYEWVPALSLLVGHRVTSGDSKYLTGTFAASLRWYALKVLGLALTPVRVEYGPKVRGDEEFDTSAGVHGDAGSQYYFQAGTRLGLVLNAGIIDILVEGPTLAWDSSPFAAKEILSFRLGIRVD